jgi:hypothetical protein
MPDLPGQGKPGKKPKFEAYLFVHMTKRDYGPLYYSASLDGLHWETLNGGQRVLDGYHGIRVFVKGTMVAITLWATAGMMRRTLTSGCPKI